MARAQVKYIDNRQRQVCRQESYHWVTVMVAHSGIPPSAHERRASGCDLKRNDPEECSQQPLPDCRPGVMPETQVQKDEDHAGDLYPADDAEKYAPHLKMAGKVASARCSAK